MTSAALPLIGAFFAIHPLGSEFRVNAYTTSAQAFPAIAAHADGSFVVVWSSPDPTEDLAGIFGERYDALGRPVGGPFHVNTYTMGSQAVPSVAAEPSGRFVVVWRDDKADGSSDSVLGRIYDGAGTPSTSPFRVNTVTTMSQSAPSVAMDAAGQFVVAFYGRDGANGYSAFERRYLSNGTPLGDEFRVNSVISGGIQAPAVSTDSSGAFVVAFGQKGTAASDYDVFVRPFSASGAPLGIDFVVNTVTAGFQSPPRISAGPGGGFVVTWPLNGLDGHRARLYGANGHALSSEIIVSSTTSNGYPGGVLTLPDGGFVAVFDGYTFPTDFTEILLRRYSANGTLVGSELRVNTSTTGRQFQPAIAGHPGGFVVVWTGKDGDSYGIFGQRFSTTPVGGDANGDGVVAIDDAFYLINFLFAGGPAPQ